PMVNVRYAVDRLARPGTISPEVARAILRAAKKLPYRDRTYPHILRKAGLWSRPDAKQLATMLASHDLKRDDAITLLETLARLEVASSHARSHGAMRPAGVRAAVPEFEEDDREDDGAARSRLAPDAPLLFWEFGPPVPFAAVVRFLAMTGELPRYARNA